MSKSVLLVSNKVMHYRIPIYNHLNSRLSGLGRQLTVLTNEVQSESPHVADFALLEESFAYRSYTRKIAEIDPDVVIFFMHIRDAVVWPLMLWLRLRRTRFIYWNHGINLQTPDSKLKNLIFSVFHYYADAIVLYSENERKHIAERHQHKVFVANNTLNFDVFPSISESKQSIRQELGIQFEHVVLFVGRVTPEKKLDDLINASAFLCDGCGVVIVGGGLNQQQERQIENSDKLKYLGEIYDNETINRVFRMADVFSIPGKIGLGLNQAFFWGLPVVTEQVLHSPEIVYLNHGENGFIVPNGNIKALANKINVLLSSTSTYDSFSENAKATIMEHGNIDKMCDGFIEAIKFLDSQ